MTGRPASSHCRYVVCQLGARMHYAVPRFLHEAGQLERLHTDIYSPPWWARSLATLPAGLQPPGLRRLAGRGSTIPSQSVRSYPWFGLQYYARIARARNHEEATAVFLWGGRAFGRRVVRDGFGSARAVYTFNTAGLEILTAARAQGLNTIVEQTIAPRAIEDEILREEHRRYPNWEQPVDGARAVQDMIAREEQEWALADLIVCASPFVRDGIRKRGGPADRCAVVPYGVDITGSQPTPPSGGRPLRVLTVGHVGLRKGAPYVLEVARKLKGVADFRWVGPIHVSAGAAAEMSAHLEMVGPVPRADVARHYEWADVFFLPSVCEGSATVTYEALSWGRPIVTTPGTGSPVRDGVDGYVVDDRDTAAMADRISRLGSDLNLLGRLSQHAREGAPALSLAAYKARLLPLLAEAAAR